MKLSDFYRWEAEMRDGSVVTQESPVDLRADLTDCIRFSMIPSGGILLPGHDIVGVPMERRFFRVFSKSYLFQKQELPGKLFWENGATVMKSTDDWTKILTPGCQIGWGVDGAKWYTVIDVKPDSVTILTPYEGKSKLNGMFCRALPPPAKLKSLIYVHCIVCRDFRLWINYETGAMLAAPKDQEVYL